MGNAPKPKRKSILSRSYESYMWLYQRWFPELLHAERGHDRSELWHNCWRDAWHTNRMRYAAWSLMMIAAWIVYFFKMPRMIEYVRTRIPASAFPDIFEYLMPFAFVAACGITSLWFMSAAVRREIRSVLQSRGILLCIKCGYDLRGQVAPRCPECGTAFEMPLSKREELSTP